NAKLRSMRYVSTAALISCYASILLSPLSQLISTILSLVSILGFFVAWVFLGILCAKQAISSTWKIASERADPMRKHQHRRAMSWTLRRLVIGTVLTVLLHVMWASASA